MNFKIDLSGCLEIERAGGMKLQHCPHDYDSFCGDWCPHFGEPGTRDVYADGQIEREEDFIELTCGHESTITGTLVADDRRRE